MLLFRMPKYYFFPQIGLDIYYFLDFLTFNFLYKNRLDFELLVRNKRRLSAGRLQTGTPHWCHWQNSRWCRGASTEDARALGTLECSGCPFSFAV